MKLVFFTHPDFLELRSMQRYSGMLAEGLKQRGHEIQLWKVKPRFFNLFKKTVFKKWMGYVDQYIVFPMEARKLLKTCSVDTLFVFTDHALGPWVPLVADKFHVIHCHDFMAQLSAMGNFTGNPVSWSGKKYQSLIRRGFTCGENFICVSEKTNEDLKKLLRPNYSAVVYNGLDNLFGVSDALIARKNLSVQTGLDLSKGYVLHVGGNQWYKNRKGVIAIYNAWRSSSSIAVPLLLLGKCPDGELNEHYENAVFKSDIHFINEPDNAFIATAYSGASLLLFPSLMEGFGWPIAEAMASGCLVATTDAAPMTEVAGNAGFYLPVINEKNANHWAEDAAIIVEKIFQLSPENRQSAVDLGIKNAKRFDFENSLDQIESNYKSILRTT